MSNFQNCLAFVLKAEGGFVDNPYDPGGATNMGITLATFQRYVPHGTVAELKVVDPAIVAAIYALGYWLPCSMLPPGVDLMVFDMAVNSGPATSAKLLQKVVGVAQDGVIGPGTLAAVAAKGAEATVLALANCQYFYYQSLAGFAEFGNGWTSRVKAREDAATAMTTSK